MSATPKPRGPGRTRRRGARKKKQAKDRWVVVQFTAAGGYSVAAIHADPQEATAAAGKLRHALALEPGYSGTYTAPVLRGRGRYVTVRKARNADADWRQAILWPTEAEARAFAARPDGGSISTAHDYVGRLPAEKEEGP